MNQGPPVVIIGYGSIGKRHARTLASLGGFARDREPWRGGAREGRGGAPFGTDRVRAGRSRPGRFSVGLFRSCHLNVGAFARGSLPLARGERRAAHPLREADGFLRSSGIRYGGTRRARGDCSGHQSHVSLRAAGASDPVVGGEGQARRPGIARRKREPLVSSPTGFTGLTLRARSSAGNPRARREPSEAFRSTPDRLNCCSTGARPSGHLPDDEKLC